MKIIYIFLAIYIGMIATAFWEAYSEGRNPWHNQKLGWKLKVGKYYLLTAYHFWLFFVMWPAILSLPFIINGWSVELFGIILSAFSSGLVLEDIFWYIANPEVKVSELYSPFSDYYPWLKIRDRKIVPYLYIIGMGVAILSWYFLWR